MEAAFWRGCKDDCEAILWIGRFSSPCFTGQPELTPPQKEELKKWIPIKVQDHKSSEDIFFLLIFEYNKRVGGKGFVKKFDLIT